MKLPLSTIQTAVESGAFAKIEACRPSMEVRFAYSRAAEEILKCYQGYQKLYADLVRQYGIKQDDKIVVYHADNTAENMAAFGDEWRKLLATEVDLACGPFSLAKLGGLELTIRELCLLGLLVVE